MAHVDTQSEAAESVDTKKSDSKVLSVLAIELLNDFVLKAGEAVQGSDFVNKSITASVAHLKKHFPKNSFLYSQGVNTYLAVVPDVNYEENPDQLKTIIDNIKAPICVDGVEYLPQPKIGYLGRELQGDEDSKELIRYATSALIQIRGTRQCSIAYTQKKDDDFSRKFKLLADLPNALKSEEQFSLAFQPIIDLKTKQCVEVECLLRWNHPVLGNVSPFMILTLVEETPLMQDITMRVIQLAIEGAQALAEHDLFPKIGVNLSAYDLYFDRIYEKLTAASQSMKPGQLIAEITETAMVDDLETIAKQLEKLKALDIRIHVDDFGVGQSSLSYLTKLPADVIKLDQSFLRQVAEDPANLKVSSGITTIAKELGFEVIMEGVEFDEDLLLAQYIQPTYLQGYNIARPMPLKNIIQWLLERNTDAK